MKEFRISGLKRDNQKCGYRDDSILFEDYSKHLNTGCPKCGEVWLTQEDYDTCLKMHKRFGWINTLNNTLKWLNPFHYLRLMFGDKRKTYVFSQEFKHKKPAIPLQYKRSGIIDVNGIEICEGSIINANGYKSRIEENYFHCVEFHEGIFGSDIYGDFEPLSTYNTIEVVGHCSEYAHLIESGDWEGNLGEVFKK